MGDGPLSFMEARIFAAAFVMPTCFGIHLALPPTWQLLKRASMA